MTSFVLSLLLAFAPSAQPDKQPIPNDSVEISPLGCLKGRVFTATPPREGELTREGPDVVGRHFRLSGPREITDLIKRYDGQLVELVGIVTKGALAEHGTGMKVGGGRVVIGAPCGDPGGTNRNTV